MDVLLQLAALHGQLSGTSSSSGDVSRRRVSGGVRAAGHAGADLGGGGGEGETAINCTDHTTSRN